MNTKSTSLFLAGAMLIATVVPAFAASPTSAAPAKSAKSCTVKKNNVAVKKTSTKAPVAAIKKTK